MPRGWQKGFTLIEILLVVSILAILLSIAVPKTANLVAERELDGAAQMLAADIRLLQQMAINNNDYNGQIATPLLNLDSSTVPCAYNISQNTLITKNVKLPNSVRMSYSYRTISFSINGIPVNGGYTITLNSAVVSGKSKYVVVAATTGRVRISDTYDVD